jgi:hypothetical protein
MIDRSCLAPAGALLLALTTACTGNHGGEEAGGAGPASPEASSAGATANGGAGGGTGSGGSTGSAGAGGAPCGDGSCQSPESCASCPADCGDCPVSPDDVLSRVECGESGEHFPLCGADTNFGNSWQGSEIDLTFLANEGPNGRWAAEFHHRPDTATMGEGYFGWNFSESNGCDIQQGESCVVRWWFRTVSPESTGAFGAKQFILGDNDGDDSDRIIGTWREWCSGSCYTFDVDKNIDGIGPNFVQPAPDTWHSVQVVVRSSSAAATADGRMAIYLDTDDASAPTDERTGLPLVATWNNGWGFGMFRNMSEDGDHVRYRIYCVELARSFDPTFRTRTQAACGDLDGGGQ